MYAVPARVGDRRIVIEFPCIECGGLLYYSHDEVGLGFANRNASCDQNHSMFFVIARENAHEIPVDELGYLIDDTLPGWESQIPEWVLALRAA